MDPPQMRAEWQDAWRILEKLPQFAIAENKFIFLFHQMVRHVVLAQIVNEHYYVKEEEPHNVDPEQPGPSRKRTKCRQYDVYTWEPEAKRISYESTCGRLGIQPLKNLPDIVDFKNNHFFYVFFCDDVEEEKEELQDFYNTHCSHGSSDHSILIFDWNGNYIVELKDKGTPHELQVSQYSRANKCIVEATQYLKSINRFEEFKDNTPRSLYKFLPLSTEFINFLNEDTDIPIERDLRKYLFVDEDQEDLLEDLREELSNIDVFEYRKWRRLPKLKLPTGENEASWKFTFILGDSTHYTMEPCSDVDLCGRLMDRGVDLEVNIQKTFRNDSVDSFMKSLRMKSEGIHSRQHFMSDKYLFGIGIKKEKKGRFANAPPKGGWKEFVGDVVPAKTPNWVDDELAMLDEDCSFTPVIHLEDMPEYSPIDSVCNNIANFSLEAIYSTFGVLMVEKVVEIATKILRGTNDDRDEIKFHPITTRKTRTKGEQELQLWGFCMIGPHHLKKESDKIPLVLLEFIKDGSYNEVKYPKHSLGTMYIGGEPIKTLMRVTSISKYKASIMCQWRRVILQSFNVFSRIILKKLSEEKEGGSIKEIINRCSLDDIGFYGTDEELPLYIWPKKTCSLHILMSAHDDSQMEEFLANMRKLQMCKHGLVTGRSVYTLKAYKESDTLQSAIEECIINNPIVLYLATTYNESCDL